MIYLRLHQAMNEEVDPERSRSKQEQQGQFRYYSEIRYNSEIFAMYSNFAT